MQVVRLTGLRTLLLFDFKAVTHLTPLTALRELRTLTVAGFDGLNHARGMQLSICTACTKLQARKPHAWLRRAVPRCWQPLLRVGVWAGAVAEVSPEQHGVHATPS